ncbi:polyisoprenoid-binding protein [Sphingomonas metalli]|uniref:Polyisoprenoid-binding protein n=1 Tax=Sphingomonas metalli TaxID=1779358 RepID=A0A916STC9_9SPHN|nr:YceI family protein [Sphingomonas metalli]GGB15719.1 polyisoprenoid-binding protein [Sphingomonas metalli]
MRFVYAAALLAAAAAPVLAQAPGLPGSSDRSVVKAGTYQVDPAHTQVTWTVNHMGFSMLSGQFGAGSGSITLDPAKPAATKVDVTFPVDQLSVTAAPFANHLKSKDFFDVANNPTARFVSTQVTPMGDHWMMNGNLTLKGVTKPVSLTVRFVGAGTNPMSKKVNFGFHATGSINRSDFGLGYAVPAVSDKVDLAINAAFTQG